MSDFKDEMIEALAVIQNKMDKDLSLENDELYTLLLSSLIEEEA